LLGDTARPKLSDVMCESAALLTDLYELRMLETYLACNLCETASFELFVRVMPQSRAFLLAAGLEPGGIDRISSLNRGAIDCARQAGTALVDDQDVAALAQRAIDVEIGARRAPR